MRSNIEAPTPYILIVSRNPAEMRILIETLTNKGFRLSIVRDGTQGYNRALATSPDLALLQTDGCNVDGHAMVRMLKSHPLTSYMPVFLISFSASPQDRLSGLKAGAVDYISQPFAIEEVIERIRIHLQLSRLSKLAQLEEPQEFDISEDESLVRSARAALGSSLADPPTVEELADSLGIAERRLLQALRRCLGISYSQFIRIERLIKAQFLLAKTSLRISEIAYEVGFSDGANFSTAFKSASV